MAMPLEPFRTWRPIDCQTRKPATWVASGRWLRIMATLVGEYR